VTPIRRNRWQLLLIALLFLLPFAAAVVLRFGGWEPPRTRNHGELLAPPLPMAAVTATRADGSDWTFENVEREWSLLLRLPRDCAEPCRERLAVLPRVREAMGRHAGKLHLFALVDATGDMPHESVLLAAGDDPAARHRFDPMALAGELPAALRQPPAAELPELWLVDPHGYLVMHYPAGFDPNGLRKDLARLVR
jgi:hypothetical protein